MLEAEETMESQPIYSNGDIVWVKLSGCWWPGEVKNQVDLPSDLISGFKNPPLAIVKFFDEDSYEYVRNWSRIHPYNSDRKKDFIKRGMVGYRSKVAHMSKFPKDIGIAEERTGGNPNILSEPEFLPPKKINLDEIFGTPTPKKGKSMTSVKKPNANEPLVTHRRFLGNDDYKAMIWIQYPGKDRRPDSEDEEIRQLNEDTRPELYCDACNFHSKNTKALVLHSSVHFKEATTNSSKRKSKKPKDCDLNDADAAGTSEQKFTQPKKPKKKNVIINEKPLDGFEDLLQDWVESDEEVAIETDTEKKSNSEIEPAISIENGVVSSPTPKLTETQITKTPSPTKSPDSKITQDDIKNCFDFDEEDEDENFSYQQLTGNRKIPRVIPEKTRASITELLEKEKLDNDNNTGKQEQKNYKDSINPPKSCEEVIEEEIILDDLSKKSAIDDSFNSTFKELMEETEVPLLEEITHTLKSEQNFHDARTVKFPDKGGTTSKSGESTKIGGTSKKRFITSFEDFEAGFKKVVDDEESQQKRAKEYMLKSYKIPRKPGSKSPEKKPPCARSPEKKPLDLKSPEKKLPGPKFLEKKTTTPKSTEKKTRAPKSPEKKPSLIQGKEVVVPVQKEHLQSENTSKRKSRRFIPEAPVIHKKAPENHNSSRPRSTRRSTLLQEEAIEVLKEEVVVPQEASEKTSELDAEIEAIKKDLELSSKISEGSTVKERPEPREISLEQLTRELEGGADSPVTKPTSKIEEIVEDNKRKTRRKSFSEQAQNSTGHKEKNKSKILEEKTSQHQLFTPNDLPENLILNNDVNQLKKKHSRSLRDSGNKSTEKPSQDDENKALREGIVKKFEASIDKPSSEKEGKVAETKKSVDVSDHSSDVVNTEPCVDTLEVSETKLESPKVTLAGKKTISRLTRSGKNLPKEHAPDVFSEDTPIPKDIRLQDTIVDDSLPLSERLKIKLRSETDVLVKGNVEQEKCELSIPHPKSKVGKLEAPENETTEGFIAKPEVISDNLTKKDAQSSKLRKRRGGSRWEPKDESGAGQDSQDFINTLSTGEHSSTCEAVHDLVQTKTEITPQKEPENLSVLTQSEVKPIKEQRKGSKKPGKDVSEFEVKPCVQESTTINAASITSVRKTTADEKPSLGPEESKSLTIDHKSEPEVCESESKVSALIPLSSIPDNPVRSSQEASEVSTNEVLTRTTRSRKKSTKELPKVETDLATHKDVCNDSKEVVTSIIGSIHESIDEKTRPRITRSRKDSFKRLHPTEEKESSEIDESKVTTEKIAVEALKEEPFSTRLRKRSEKTHSPEVKPKVHISEVSHKDIKETSIPSNLEVSQEGFKGTSKSKKSDIGVSSFDHKEQRPERSRSSKRFVCETEPQTSEDPRQPKTSLEEVSNKESLAVIEPEKEEVISTIPRRSTRSSNKEPNLERQTILVSEILKGLHESKEYNEIQITPTASEVIGESSKLTITSNLSLRPEEVSVTKQTAFDKERVQPQEESENISVDIREKTPETASDKKRKPPPQDESGNVSADIGEEATVKSSMLKKRLKKETTSDVLQPQEESENVSVSTEEKAPAKSLNLRKSTFKGTASDKERVPPPQEESVYVPVDLEKVTKASKVKKSTFKQTASDKERKPRPQEESGNVSVDIEKATLKLRKSLFKETASNEERVAPPQEKSENVSAYTEKAPAKSSKFKTSRSKEAAFDKERVPPSQEESGNVPLDIQKKATLKLRKSSFKETSSNEERVPPPQEESKNVSADMEKAPATSSKLKRSRSKEAAFDKERVPPSQEESGNVPLDIEKTATLKLRKSSFKETASNEERVPPPQEESKNVFADMTKAPAKSSKLKRSSFEETAFDKERVLPPQDESGNVHLDAEAKAPTKSSKLKRDKLKETTFNKECVQPPQEKSGNVPKDIDKAPEKISKLKKRAFKEAASDKEHVFSEYDPGQEIASKLDTESKKKDSPKSANKHKTISRKPSDETLQSAIINESKNIFCENLDVANFKEFSEKNKSSELTQLCDEDAKPRSSKARKSSRLSKLSDSAPKEILEKQEDSKTTSPEDQRAKKTSLDIFKDSKLMHTKSRSLKRRASKDEGIEKDTSDLRSSNLKTRDMLNVDIHKQATEDEENGSRQIFEECKSFRSLRSTKHSSNRETTDAEMLPESKEDCLPVFRKNTKSKHEIFEKNVSEQKIGSDHIGEISNDLSSADIRVKPEFKKDIDDIEAGTLSQDLSSIGAIGRVEDIPLPPEPEHAPKKSREFCKTEFDIEEIASEPYTGISSHPAKESHIPIPENRSKYHESDIVLGELGTQQVIPEQVLNKNETCEKPLSYPALDNVTKIHVKDNAMENTGIFLKIQNSGDVPRLQEVTEFSVSEAAAIDLPPLEDIPLPCEEPKGASNRRRSKRNLVTEEDVKPISSLQVEQKPNKPESGSNKIQELKTLNERGPSPKDTPNSEHRQLRNIVLNEYLQLPARNMSEGIASDYDFDSLSLAERLKINLRSETDVLANEDKPLDQEKYGKSKPHLKSKVAKLQPSAAGTSGSFIPNPEFESNKSLKKDSETSTLKKRRGGSRWEPKVECAVPEASQDFMEALKCANKSEIFSACETVRHDFGMEAGTIQKEPENLALIEDQAALPVAEQQNRKNVSESEMHEPWVEESTGLKDDSLKFMQQTILDEKLTLEPEESKSLIIDIKTETEKLITGVISDKVYGNKAKSPIRSSKPRSRWDIVPKTENGKSFEDRLAEDTEPMKKIKSEIANIELLKPFSISSVLSSDVGIVEPSTSEHIEKVLKVNKPLGAEEIAEELKQITKESFSQVKSILDRSTTEEAAKSDQFEYKDKVSASSALLNENHTFSVAGVNQNQVVEETVMAVWGSETSLEYFGSEKATEQRTLVCPDTPTKIKESNKSSRDIILEDWASETTDESFDLRGIKSFDLEGEAMFVDQPFVPEIGELVESEQAIPEVQSSASDLQLKSFEFSESSALNKNSVDTLKISAPVLAENVLADISVSEIPLPDECAKSASVTLPIKSIVKAAASIPENRLDESQHLQSDLSEKSTGTLLNKVSNIEIQSVEIESHSAAQPPIREELESSEVHTEEIETDSSCSQTHPVEFPNKIATHAEEFEVVTTKEEIETDSSYSQTYCQEYPNKIPTHAAEFDVATTKEYPDKMATHADAIEVATTKEDKIQTDSLCLQTQPEACPNKMATHVEEFEVTTTKEEIRTDPSCLQTHPEECPTKIATQSEKDVLVSTQKEEMKPYPSCLQIHPEECTDKIATHAEEFAVETTKEEIPTDSLFLDTHPEECPNKMATHVEKFELATTKEEEFPTDSSCSQTHPEECTDKIATHAEALEMATIKEEIPTDSLCLHTHPEEYPDKMATHADETEVATTQEEVIQTDSSCLQTHPEECTDKIATHAEKFEVATTKQEEVQTDSSFSQTHPEEYTDKIATHAEEFEIATTKEEEIPTDPSCSKTHPEEFTDKIATHAEEFEVAIIKEEEISTDPSCSQTHPEECPTEVATHIEEFEVATTKEEEIPSDTSFLQAHLEECPAKMATHVEEFEVGTPKEEDIPTETLCSQTDPEEGRTKMATLVEEFEKATTKEEEIPGDPSCSQTHPEECPTEMATHAEEFEKATTKEEEIPTDPSCSQTHPEQCATEMATHVEEFEVATTKENEIPTDPSCLQTHPEECPIKMATHLDEFEVATTKEEEIPTDPSFLQTHTEECPAKMATHVEEFEMVTSEEISIVETSILDESSIKSLDHSSYVDNSLENASCQVPNQFMKDQVQSEAQQQTLENCISSNDTLEHDFVKKPELFSAIIPDIISKAVDTIPVTAPEGKCILPLEPESSHLLRQFNQENAVPEYTEPSQTAALPKEKNSNSENEALLDKSKIYAAESTKKEVADIYETDFEEHLPLVKKEEKILETASLDSRKGRGRRRKSSVRESGSKKSIFSDVQNQKAIEKALQNTLAPSERAEIVSVEFVKESKDPQKGQGVPKKLFRRKAASDQTCLTDILTPSTVPHLSSTESSLPTFDNNVDTSKKSMSVEPDISENVSQVDDNRIHEDVLSSTLPPKKNKWSRRISCTVTTLESDTMLKKATQSPTKINEKKTDAFDSAELILPLKKSKRISESIAFSADNISPEKKTSLDGLCFPSYDDSFMSTSLRDNIEGIIKEIDTSVANTQSDSLEGRCIVSNSRQSFEKLSDEEPKISAISSVPPKKKKIEIPKEDTAMHTDHTICTAEVAKLEIIPQAPKKKIQKLFESSQAIQEKTEKCDLPLMSPLAKKKSFWFQQEELDQGLQSDLNENDFSSQTEALRRKRILEEKGLLEDKFHAKKSRLENIVKISSRENKSILSIDYSSQKKPTKIVSEDLSILTKTSIETNKEVITEQKVSEAPVKIAQTINDKFSLPHVSSISNTKIPESDVKTLAEDFSKRGFKTLRDKSSLDIKKDAVYQKVNDAIQDSSGQMLIQSTGMFKNIKRPSILEKPRKFKKITLGHQVRSLTKITSLDPAPSEKDRSTTLPHIIPGKIPNEPELVSISVAPTVMSEQDLADSQVEITSDKVISAKPSLVPAIQQIIKRGSPAGSPKSETRGTEFTSKAMLKEFDNKTLKSHTNTYFYKSELLDILEGNSNSSTNSATSSGSEQKFKTFFDNYEKNKGTVQGIIDFEEEIPSQIVVANKAAAASVLMDSPKLLQRLSLPSDQATVSHKVLTTKDIKPDEGMTKKVVGKVTKTGVPKPGQKILIKKPRASGATKTVSSKPIILSEQIIRPANTPTSAEQNTSIGLKRPYEDIEDVEKPFIISKVAKTEPSEESTTSTITPKVAKSRKSSGKAMILQQTIITPKGEIIPQPQAPPITPATSSTSQKSTQQVTQDDTVFDINAMPIVISDDLLTPESIQNMPVVLSEDVVTQSTLLPSTQSQEKGLPGAIQKKASVAGKQHLMFKPTSQGHKPRILQNPGKVTKPIGTPALLATGTTADGKTAKYVLVPPTGTPIPEVKPIKPAIMKKSVSLQPKVTTPAVLSSAVAAAALSPAVPAPESSNPAVGNKIMIVTNAQGQQTRLVLTPQQQKAFMGQGGSKTKAIIKGTFSKGLLETAIAAATTATGTHVTKSVAITVPGTTTPISSHPSGLLMPVTKTVVKPIVPQKKVPQRAKPQKTILIKNQLGQTVRKIQGTDDADLDRQVAEQLEAIKASARLQQATLAVKPAPEVANVLNRTTINTNKPPHIRRTQVKKNETPRPKIPVSMAANLPAAPREPEKQEAKIPALAPLSPHQRVPQVPQTTTPLKTVEKQQAPLPSKTVNPLVSMSSKPVEINQSPVPAIPDSSTQRETDEKRPDSPVKQLVIQDSLGNLTTVTVGQILAIPSETVDGQPQSYMLVTVDESGNLTALNNDALMSIDPSLGVGGDSNIVLQMDQGQGTVASIKSAESGVITTTSVDEMKKTEERLRLEVPIKPEPLKETVQTEEPLLTEKLPIVEQQVVIGEGIIPGDSGGQQLLLSGDPIATQKFLESLSDGSTDLANILANAEGGSVMIQADGQNILIRTTPATHPGMAISESSEGGGNPIFGTHKPNQDILAAALANTDVFPPSDTSLVSQGKGGLPTSQLSPGAGGALYPMHVGTVLETSLTLSSPIMTPLEVPRINSKKIDDEADILNPVPKNVDLPITITDPNIVQTVAHQSAGLMELNLPISETGPSVEMNSPSYSYALPTLDDSVGISQKHFGSSMPLLTEDLEESNSISGKSKPYLSSKDRQDKFSHGLGSFSTNPDDLGTSREEVVKTSSVFDIESMPILTDDVIEDNGSSMGSTKPQRSSPKTIERDLEEEGLSTLGGEMCSSLSEPPPDMFDLSSFMTRRKEEEMSSDMSSLPEPETLSINSENSGEIPLQPPIVANLRDLKRTSDSESSDDKRARLE